MHPFQPFAAAALFQHLLQEVFHSLHVVVGGFLNGLDRCGILRSEFLCAGSQGFLAFGGKLYELLFMEEKQVFHFHAHAVADQTELGEILRQVGCLFSVAAVDRGERDQGGEVHSRGVDSYLCVPNLVQLSKIRVGAVSYRNAKPLVHGIALPEMTGIMELSYDYPARLVDQLRAHQIDIGLIPVAAIQGLPGARVIGHHAIAADGAVESVALFSQCPIDQVEEVVLDYQSRTSVELAKILLRDFWKRPVQYIHATGDDYIQDIQGPRAGLIIGDRALLNATRYAYVYDLAAAWKLHTGLPFVFAVWVSLQALSTDFINQFEQANEIGLHQLEDLAREWALPGVDMLSYYRDRIHYRLNESKQAGLRSFLALLKS